MLPGETTSIPQTVSESDIQLLEITSRAVAGNGVGLDDAKVLPVILRPVASGI
jgi:hypothetical protein